MIDGLQLGTIQGYIGPADFFVGVDPRFGVFSAPMLFQRRTTTRRRPSTIRHSTTIILDLAEPKASSASARFGARRRRTTPPSARSCGFPISPARSSASTPPRMERAEDEPARRHRRAMPLERGVARAAARAPSTAPSAALRSSSRSRSTIWSRPSLSPTTPCWCRSPWSARSGSTSCRPICKDRGRHRARRCRHKTQDWELDFSKQLDDDWAKLGGKMHTLPAEDLAKMKTLLEHRRRRRDQGPAGGARYAQESPRGRGEALTRRGGAYGTSPLKSAKRRHKLHV